MKIVIKKPGEPAALFKVDRRRSNTIDSIIDGIPVQCFRLRNPDRRINLIGWCDDDGYSKGLPLNFARPTDGHEILGTVVITSETDTKNGPDWGGLNDNEIAEAIELMAAIAPARRL